MKPKSKAIAISVIVVLVIAIIVALKVSNKSDNGNSGVASTETKIEDTPAAQEERARINKLDKITAENVSTQVEKKGDKKVLKDRRLFVNNLKAENVTTSKKLISKLEDIEDSVKKDGIEFTDSDAYVIIAGYALENQNWTLCGDFNANKKSLDSKNKYFSMIDGYCNPATEPKSMTAANAKK